MRANNDLHEITQIRKIWRFLCGDGDAPVVQTDCAPAIVSTCHDVLQDFDILRTDFIPDWNNGAIRRFRMKQEPQEIESVRSHDKRNVLTCRQTC